VKQSPALFSIFPDNKGSEKISCNLNSGIEVKYIAESLDHTSSSCIESFDRMKILEKVKDFQVDAVIAFSFDKCHIMEEKTKNVCQMLNNHGINAMSLNAGYMEMYQNEYAFQDKIKRFLKT